MTPKEKAKELIEKWFNAGYGLNTAKQIATWCVEEILNYERCDNKIFWEQVKEEIKNS